MKVNFNDARTKSVLAKIDLKEKRLKKVLGAIKKAIVTKSSDLDSLISERNSLSVDLSQLEQQHENLRLRKNQYGEEILERSDYGCYT